MRTAHTDSPIINDSDTGNEPDTICRDVVELLPWLLNGSLDAEEEGRLRIHLADCESCRHEQREAARDFGLLDVHIPSMALAEYAVGLPTSEIGREELERHLNLCLSCRRELDRAMSDNLVDFEAARFERTSRAAEADRSAAQWRRLAVAASLIAALSSTGWIWDRITSSPAPAYERRTLAEAAERQDVPSAALGAPDPARILFSDGFETGNNIAWSSEPPTRVSNNG